MQNLSLQQLFGEGASQDSEYLIIRKPGLPMTISDNNRAEQLLVALILQAWNEFEGLLIDESGDTILDETGNAISYDQRELYEKRHLWYWQRQFTGGKVLDTFVVNIFVTPPSNYGTALSASQL